MNARILSGILIMTLVCLTVGCAAQEEGGLFGGGGNNGGNLGFGNVAFQLPEENEVITAPFTISALADGIAFAVFHVDGTQVAVLTVPPFELEIDPLDLSKGGHRVGVTVIHTSGDEARSAVDIMVIRPRPPLADIMAAIDGLAPGEWYEIPETPVRDVDWGKDHIGHARGNISSIVGGGSGGCYDTKRDRLVIWGGGGTSTRNDLYAFDLNLATWARLTDPSEFADGAETNTFGVVTHPDGAPVSRHSYDNIDYLPPPVDRLYLGGGHFASEPETKSYVFNFDTNWWEIGPDITSATVGGHGGVDGDNIVWQQGSGQLPRSVLSQVDVGGHTSSDHAEYVSFYNQGGTSDVDPMRRLLVAVGNDETRVWDLENPDDASVVWNTTGDTGIQAAFGPGCVYDPVRDRLVCWAGGKDVFALDLDTKVWTRLAGQGDVDPGPASSILGRWRYVPSKDVFIVVTGADRNVIIHRLGLLP